MLIYARISFGMVHFSHSISYFLLHLSGVTAPPSELFHSARLGSVLCTETITQPGKTGAPELRQGKNQDTEP